jgi:hypothetical protein
MMWHPLSLAVWVGDLLSWAIGLDAARRLIGALPQWDPTASGRSQLMRERSLELAAYQGQWIFMLQAATFLLLIIGISHVWSAVVPGAMCGTGVLQAMGVSGVQTVLFRISALLILYAWRTAVKINSRHPQGMLWPDIGRLFLLGLPFMLLGTVTWGQAIAAVDPAHAVDCCAVVYAEAAVKPATGHTGLQPNGHMWIASCMIGAAVLVAVGLVRRQRPAWGGRWLGVVLCIVTLGWAALGIHSLRFGFGPYIYEVLHHACPWCFFLPEHFGVGFVFFGAMAVICMEQTAAGISAAIAGRKTVLADAALERLRSSQWRILGAMLVFCAAAMLPVLKWRLQFGGWMF